MSEVVWLAIPGLRIRSSRSCVASSPMYWPGWSTEVSVIPGSSARLELSKLITERSAGILSPGAPRPCTAPSPPRRWCR